MDGGYCDGSKTQLKAIGGDKKVFLEICKQTFRGGDFLSDISGKRKSG